MSDRHERAVAIVGLAAILPDAPNAAAFWQNICEKRYSISEVPADRWSAADYFDDDPAAPDKTYSKIGGWVRGFHFDWKRFHIPPRVAEAMDESQQWAVTIAAEALADYGQRGLDLERTAVVFGTAMGGEMHDLTTLRICFPEFSRALCSVSEFLELPAEVRQKILSRWHEAVGRRFPAITEDTMPGELANIVSGRVANVLNLRGPNFITDAACASTFAAVDASVDLLVSRHCDAVITGGVDRNMGIGSFVKFCKIGALSATGTRPFGDGADGFVMGEGCAAFLLKRLADAERDGDRVYAVIRGVAGSSDGRGKGITAPNPVGQRLAIRRAWDDAGLDPATATLVEAHGTSTKVGDVVEVESLGEVFGKASRGAIALGSVKSNLGHLKAGAGAAGLAKAVLALHRKMLPPTLHAERPNPGIDFAATPFALCHDLAEWKTCGTPRRAGVSAYGFGGTNFHLVLEEHVPGSLTRDRAALVSVPAQAAVAPPTGPAGRPSRVPLRGIAALGAGTPEDLRLAAEGLLSRAREGVVPAAGAPDPAALSAPERLVVDFASPKELIERLEKARKAFGHDTPAAWRPLAGQGVFRGRGPRAGKLAFLFPGQGSQYVNMGRALSAREPVVAGTFAEADRALTPLLGRPISEYVFVDAPDPAALKTAEAALMQTTVAQPALLTLNVALHRLLVEHGFEPDLVMGHSFGEYAALVAAGVMPLDDAFQAAAARGREMTRVSLDDNGQMAAVMAPAELVEEVLAGVEGYVVAANLNSRKQCVIGGATPAIAQAVDAFRKRGVHTMRLPVSHAFHTRIVAPASAPLRQFLDRLRVSPPCRPVVANVTGDLYPSDASGIKHLLERQIASPVQWVRSIETAYALGVRTFVEVGPKRALKGFVEEILDDRPDVVTIHTNQPKPGDVESFNQALCGLYAAGWGLPAAEPVWAASSPATLPAPTPAPAVSPAAPAAVEGDRLDALTRLLEQTLERLPGSGLRGPYDRNEAPLGSIVISGTGLGLPGSGKPVMDPGNAERILRGERFVDLLPEGYRRGLANKRITRVVKGEDGSGRFATIEDTGDVIKLAGRGGPFDLVAEYGVPEKLVEALDITTQLAMAAGLDALREAGIPLVQTWKKTTTGKHLPERWLLPEALRDETGVIFASAFPGYDRFADELARYHTDEGRRLLQDTLEDLRSRTSDPSTLAEIQRRLAEVDALRTREPYAFDRRFLFRVLTMGHSQFAEYVGARGPNAHVNAACASTAQGLALAEDWIRGGRCRRVIVIGADNVTSPRLFEWIGSGFLATGAAATDDKVEEAALPFDRRRHGTLIGMGACGLVVESQDAVEERGMRGIVELLASEARNSAHHATRLDVHHIAGVVESLVAAAERRFGLNRFAMAPQTVFVSHETFTPARGGSAAAEVEALRAVFGAAASEIVVANTKGFTGHPMGVGIEDVIGVKMLEHGIVPPVPNYKEVDPDLGRLNLSRGGRYPVRYALHLAAGFGSQLALTLTRRVPGGLDRVDSPATRERWLADVTGYDRPATAVVKRVLRVVSPGAPGRVPAPSTWRQGLGPSRRTPATAEVPGLATLPGFPATLPSAPPAPAPGPVVIPAAPAPARPSPAAPAAPAPVAPAADATSDVVRRVMAIVAEKTGYPPEMLDLDLDLEADLGVDTVKQAETFAAVREEWRIPRQETLKLRDFPTLRHVVKFVFDHRPDLAAAPAPAAPKGFAVPAPVTPPTGATEALVQRDDATPPATVPVAAAPVAAAADAVTRRVMEIVAEKTGYPPEMLELDLDLEADLGVDTVKQAETFAAVREEWSIARQESLKLRDFPSLRHVVKFVFDHRPDLAPPDGSGPGSARAAGASAHDAGAAPASTAHAPAVPVASPAAAVPGASTTAAPAALPLENADRFPRRVPVPVLRPPLEQCRPTGVVLESGARVVVVDDAGGVAKAMASRLKKRGASVLSLDPTDDAVGERAAALLAEGPIQGVFWLPALDAEPPLASLDLEAFHAQGRVRVKALYDVARAVYEALAQPGRFLLSGTRMGGFLGQGPEPASAPLGGAVAGFTKALRKERPEALVKVVDFETAARPDQVAEALLAEALSDPGALEVGRARGRRFTIGLEERPARDGRPGLPLGPDSVFVVTGAAGGITSAIVADLAAASRGTFYLLDLAALPAADDPHVKLLREDREKLKLRFIDEARARGEKPLPPAIERQILDVERQDAALRAMQAVEAAGGRAAYCSLNLLDGAAVAAAIDEVRRAHGRIDVLLHAGGIEISRELPQKPFEEFARVFHIKADGFFSLLKAAEGMPIGATVVFSSVAGRFGNAGQTDYSAANAFLCAMSSHLRSLRPETRTIALDWTAWAGIGMATRGSIPKIMEAAGVEMLPPEVGIPTVRRELVAGGGSGEIVVAGRLGAMAREWDETGGLDLAACQAHVESAKLLMVGRPVAATLYGGLVTEARLDPAEQPFLRDHALEGTPLLPGVMAAEAFAQIARLMAPDMHVLAVEDALFDKPFKYYRSEPAAYRLRAIASPSGADELAVDATLLSLIQPKPDVPAVEKLHFRARVRLGRKAPRKAKTPFDRPAAGSLPIQADAIYRVYFHGPAYKVLDRVRVTGAEALGLMARALPPNSAPPDAASLLDPRLIELCFQTAGIQEIVADRRLALPRTFRSVRVLRPAWEADRRRLWARVTRQGDSSFSAVVVDDEGRVYVELEGYETVVLEEGRSLPE